MTARRLRRVTGTAKTRRGSYSLLLLAAGIACTPLAPAHGGPPAVAAVGIAATDRHASDHPLSSRATSSDGVRTANFLGEAASDDARHLADWAVASGDNDGLPFVIIDKRGAKVFVFGSDGELRGATFALLGRALGDDTVPGIGTRKLSAIRPEERTTPAGRFVAVLGRDFQQDILWIDYDAAISLHRVVKGAPGDNRLQRLATSSTLDKRISYGCVNVPVAFYDDVVLTTFTAKRGIVYILPEVKALADVFPKLRAVERR